MISGALREEMRTAAINGELKELTISVYPELIGKRIQTIYFGYLDQYGVDDFVVGELISEWDLAGRKDFSEIDPRFKTRQEYWASFMRSKEIAECKNTLTILTSEGKQTYISLHPDYDEQHFSCSDLDRFVLYRIIE